MTERLVAKKGPFPLDVEQGQTYYWCSCGKSAKQPLCDGSHKGSGLAPVAFTAEDTKRVYLCGCKATANEPFCDGYHKKM